MNGGEEHDGLLEAHGRESVARGDEPGAADGQIDETGGEAEGRQGYRFARKDQQAAEAEKSSKTKPRQDEERRACAGWVAERKGAEEGGGKLDPRCDLEREIQLGADAIAGEGSEIEAERDDDQGAEEKEKFD